MRTHCRGAYPEFLWLAAADRLAPLETGSFRSLRDIGLFSALSAVGGSTPTDRRMLLYKWWFENQLRMHPDLRCFTLSTEGIAIKGSVEATVEDVLALPVVRPEIDRRMRKVREIHEAQDGSGDARAKLEAAIGELGGQLADLEALALGGRARSRELGALLHDHREVGTCITAMDEIDRGILSVAARSIAGFLIQSVIHGITGEGEREAEPKEIVARSEAMYAGIAESAAWQRTLLERAAASLGEARGRPSRRLPARPGAGPEHFS